MYTTIYVLRCSNKYLATSTYMLFQVCSKLYKYRTLFQNVSRGTGNIFLNCFCKYSNTFANTRIFRRYIAVLLYLFKPCGLPRFAFYLPLVDIYIYIYIFNDGGKIKKSHGNDVTVTSDKVITRGTIGWKLHCSLSRRCESGIQGRKNFRANTRQACLLIERFLSFSTCQLCFVYFSLFFFANNWENEFKRNERSSAEGTCFLWRHKLPLYRRKKIYLSHVDRPEGSYLCRSYMFTSRRLSRCSIRDSKQSVA